VYTYAQRVGWLCHKAEQRIRKAHKADDLCKEIARLEGLDRFGRTPKGFVPDQARIDVLYQELNKLLS
jgi:hypothetical protein